MNKSEKYVQNFLFENQDTTYKKFQGNLIPTINSKSVIGVRIPVIRKFAKEFAKTDMAQQFLNSTPHKYYEENNVHCCLIQENKDFNSCISEIESFLPYIDNWATSDLLSPKIFKKHTDELLPKIKEWLNSKKTYTIRVSIKMLMDFYLSDEHFNSEYPTLAASVKSKEYYVNMMIAWYFATALTKQYNITLPFIESKVLDDWTHNKTIQKSIESYRITPEQKAYLRTLKIPK